MTTKEKIEVMHAYEDGKKIQCKYREYGDEMWEDSPIPSWNFACLDYRIKPESKYRPYKDTDEMIADWIKRYGYEVPSTSIPLIWIWDKVKVEKTLVTGFRWKDINTTDAIITMVSLFQSYTYLDGSPCGKEASE